MADKAKTGPAVVEQRERDFLTSYYAVKSPTRFDRRASAIAAGYTPKMALWNANRLLDKFESKSVKDCAEAVGLTPPALAVMLRENLDNAEGKEQLSGLRLAMANRGEHIDAASAKININEKHITTIRMIGIAPEELEAVAAGYLPKRKEPACIEAERHVLELPAATYEGEIELEKEAIPTQDTRKLSARDFSGSNLTEARRSKGPSY